jgi:hypothetical protein
MEWYGALLSVGHWPNIQLQNSKGRIKYYGLNTNTIKLNLLNFAQKVVFL